MSKVIAFTFARAGSKGVPNKNIRLLNGKPLLQYALCAAKGSNFIQEHYVSTDGKEIAKVALNDNAKVIERPDKLSSDTANEWHAWQHAVQELLQAGLMSEKDIFVSVPCTSPLRNTEDLDKVITAFLSNKCDLALGITQSDHNPYFNMVKSDSNNIISLLCESEKYVRRQDVPAAWNITTMAYVTTAEFILRGDGVLCGETLGVQMDKARSLDIDTELDFLFAEFLMNKQLGEL